MSTHPQTKEERDAIYRQTLRRLERDEHKGRGEDYEEPVAGGMLTLSANAGAWGEAVKIIARPDLEPFTADRLERNASEFLLIGEASLSWFGVPDPAREFVRWVLGASGGRFESAFRFTDVQFSALYNYTTRTVQERRASLLEWQEDNKATLIRVVEGSFDTETGKHRPTEYTALFGRGVAKLIRQAREIPQFNSNPVRSVENADTSGLMPLIEEMRDDINENLSIRRKERAPKPPKDDKVVIAGDAWRSIRRGVQKWSDAQYRMGNDYMPMLHAGYEELTELAAGAPARFQAEADKQSAKVKRKGGRGNHRK